MAGGCTAHRFFKLLSGAAPLNAPVSVLKIFVAWHLLTGKPWTLRGLSFALQSYQKYVVEAAADSKPENERYTRCEDSVNG